MRFLNSQRVVSNMKLVADYLCDKQGARGNCKLEFFKAINSAQSTSIPALPDSIHIEFAHTGLVDVLVERTVFSCG